MIDKSQRSKLLDSAPRIPAVCEGPGVEGLVSVVIPTFNRAYILAQSIDSVLAQTYSPIELIVVDDGSSDGTRELVARYGDRVRYIYQENAGLAAARNTGFTASRGEFLAFQDSDDVWVPWKVAAQVAVMRSNPEIGLVWTDMTAVTPEGEVREERYLRKMYQRYAHIDLDEHMPVRGRVRDVDPTCPPELAEVEYRSGDIFGALFLGNLVHPPTALLRRDHVQRTGGLDLTFAMTCEDYEFFTRVARVGHGALIEAPAMLYRVDAPDQITEPGALIFVARGNLAVLKRRMKEDRTRLRHLPAKQIRRHFAGAYHWLARSELESKHGGRRKAMTYYVRSVMLDPSHARNLLFFAVSVSLPDPLLVMAREFKARLRGSVALLLAAKLIALAMHRSAAGLGRFI